MIDVTLSTGRVLAVDMSKVTIRAYRALFDPAQTHEQEDATVAKVLGISVDDLLSLSQPDYRRAVKAFFDAAKAPLDDPKV
jgi:hypothetical protein